MAIGKNSLPVGTTVYHYIEFYIKGGIQMKRKGSRIADSIMREYDKKKKYEEKIKKEREEREDK